MSIILDEGPATGGDVFDDDATLYEVVEGERVENPPMGALENQLANALLRHATRYLDRHPLGLMLLEVLFELPAVRRQRRPDLAFVSTERWPRDQRVPRANSFPVVPDIAIEIISLTNTLEAILEKLREYFAAGVRQCLVVIPAAEQVYVYSSPTQPRVYTRDDVIEGEPILPEFRLPVGCWFDLNLDP